MCRIKTDRINFRLPQPLFHHLAQVNLQTTKNIVNFAPRILFDMTSSK